MRPRIGRLFAAVAVVVACAWPHAARAQNASAQVADLEARLRSTDIALREARRKVDSVRALPRPNLPDSVVAGALVVRFTTDALGPGGAAALQRAANLSWTDARTVLGASADSLVRGHPIDVRAEYAYANWWQQRQVWLSFQFADHSPRYNSLRAPVRETPARDVLSDLIGALATNGESPKLVLWLGAWMPARPTAPQAWEDVAVDLATSPSTIARACHVGALAQCEAALGLTDAGDELLSWYDADDRRAIVLRAPPNPTADEQVTLHKQCVKQRSDASCIAFLRTRTVPRPLHIDSRRTLFAYALERGGPNAYARLRAAQAGTPVRALLAAASGIDTPTLVRDWRAHALAASPDLVTPSVLQAGVMLGWIALLGVAATRRRP